MARRKKKPARDIDPREQLRIFIDAADRLAATPVFKHADSWSSLRISWHQGGPLQFSGREPSADQLDLVLMRLRPFLLSDDWTHISRMYNLLRNQVRSDELRNYVQEARRIWIRQQQNDGIKLEVDGQDLTPEYVARLYMYGGPQPFHWDPEAMQELQGLGMGRFFARDKYLAYILQASQHVFSMARIAREVRRFDLLDD